MPPSWPAALARVLLLAAAAGLAAGSVDGGADLSNFQNELACDNTTVLIVRPRTVRDIQEAVALHDTVMANGAGHSWNEPFFCAGAPAGPAGAAGSAGVPVPSRLVAASGSRRTAVNIALTTMRPFAIDVDTDDGSVWVDGGHLSNYVTEDAPAGWTLPAFPWFVYQSIAGAIATGTHGSSLAWASLSSERQLLALEVVVADGSMRRFTPEEQPFLFRALRVSVGRLGVISRAKLRIVREVPVRRTLLRLTPPAFLQQVAQLQEAARAVDAGAPGAALPSWANETQFFWVPQKYEFMMVGYQRADDADDAIASEARAGFTPDATSVFESKGALLALGEITLTADAVLNLTAAQLTDQQPLSGALAERAAAAVAGLKAAINAPLPRGDDHPALGEAWARPTPNRPSAFYAAANMAEGTNEASRLGIQQVAGNATLESTAAYIKQPNTTLSQLRRILYDQYEVSFPLSVAADCLGAVLETAYGTDLLGEEPANRLRDKGFRTAPLIRLVGREDGLLSHTHDGPRVYFNLEDYLFYNQGRRPNPQFRAIMATLTGDDRCSARGPVRLHWGKAGWPDAGCWRGDEAYGNNWCSFGCAVRALDPGGKFRDSAPDRWTWAGVDLDRCCGPDGFDGAREGCACRVAHARPREDCPPPPFYTMR
ncbi:MAG: hypothetical protein J3K34DRAFT_519583 [Monoraphidium minutum]|nr:MAG: hypothetical protein J3K34DRAFT_519583 [Monoraphidium minutum]